MSLFNKRINNELKKYAKEEFMFPNVLLKPNESNLVQWFFIIYDLDGDYTSGYYFGEILLSPEYPLKPPDFRMYTPNGRFETSKKICTSFTGFHSSDHASSQNIVTLSQGVISFMTDDAETGIGSITLKHGDAHIIKENRRTFAKNSKKWNSENKLFQTTFSSIDLEKIGCI